MAPGAVITGKLIPLTDEARSAATPVPGDANRDAEVAAAKSGA
jgi:hypothetical protein